MQTNIDESVVLIKTRELCQTLLEAPDFEDVRRQIDNFMSSDLAKEQYQRVAEKMDVLNQKKQMGLDITDEEIDSFNSDRKQLMENPVAKGFIEAQQEVQRMQDFLNQYVAKTFELGRVPQDSDFRSGCSDGGCGCK